MRNLKSFIVSGAVLINAEDYIKNKFIKIMYDSIFHSFIWKTKLNYNGKNSLIEKIENIYVKNPDRTPKGWSCKVHSSFDDKELNFYSHIPKDLMKLFEDKIYEFLNMHGEKIKISGKYMIKNVWYNAYGKNQFQEPHTHQGSLFSGCYYLKFNKNKHHQTIFYNPNHSVKYCNVKDNPYFCYSPDCEEGDLIIFPSNLKHGTEGIVDNNECDELRITVSFNVVNDYVFLQNNKNYLNNIKYK